MFLRICFVPCDRLIHPFGIEVEDYDRLCNPVEWLNDTMVNALALYVPFPYLFLYHELTRGRFHSWEANAYWEMLGDRPDELAVVPSSMYRDFVKNMSCSAPIGMRIWFTDEEEASWVFRPYVFFIINVHDNHWILALVHHLADIRTYTPAGPAPESKTSIIILDSLGGRHPIVTANLCRFIEYIVLPRWGLAGFKIRHVPVHYPKASPLHRPFCLPIPDGFCNATGLPTGWPRGLWIVPGPSHPCYHA